MKKMINIQGKYKITTYRNLTVSHKGFEKAYRKIVFFPEIRMAGKWLYDSGFEPGDKVLVRVCRNRIILEKKDN